MEWFKRWLVAVILASSVAGCAQLIQMERDVVSWKKRTFFPDSPELPARAEPKYKALQTAVPPTNPLDFKPEGGTPEAELQKYCDWARIQFGLPILFNRELKNTANSKLGKDEAAKLFWPVAQANNTFRCVCGTEAERKLAKC